MAEERRFLIGNGDDLRESANLARHHGGKKHAYSLTKAKERLVPKLRNVVSYFGQLDLAACPANQATALVTLHPSYIAKSYYPVRLLKELELRHLGSRSRGIIPERVPGERGPREVETVELYVSGKRKMFEQWARTVGSWSSKNKLAEDLIKIEDIRPLTPELRLKPIQKEDPNPLLEAVVHASKRDAYIREGFSEYLRTLDIDLDLDNRYFQVRGLCFFPIRVPQEMVETMAKFSFLRVARPMPRLRKIKPVVSPIRQAGRKFPCKLPPDETVSPDVRCAVFDGGLPAEPSLERYVTIHEPSGLGQANRGFQEHGLAVTSGVLFGHIEKGRDLPRPPGRIDHYRVLDEASGEGGDNELYDVLGRIDGVLRNRGKRYDFINLSIGPSLPVEDNDIHAWTAVLDDHLSGGATLATIAVGNDGELDRQSGNARIQVPADCVNALAVGACDRVDSLWKRAAYSSIGPGRSPGIVKPDLVSFGGTEQAPFHVLSVGKGLTAIGTYGTSFASPLALRMGMTVRAYMGEELNPLVLRALLINRTEQNDEDIEEIGWGKLPNDVDDLLVCKDGEVRVIWHGALKPGRCVRLPIPVPKGPIPGIVRITATFCFASKTDPEDSINYTRSGLDITFRPDRDRRTHEQQVNPDRKTFFTRKKYSTEAQLRRDFHKWETTLHGTKRMRGTGLNEPCFDVHHVGREHGQAVPSGATSAVPYALVINIEAKRLPNIYDQVLTQYRKLRVLTPRIRIPVRVGEGHGKRKVKTGKLFE